MRHRGAAVVLGLVRCGRCCGRGPDDRPQFRLVREGAAYPPRSGDASLCDMAHPTRLGSHGMRQERNRSVRNAPAWYKDAVIYQLHVKSFFGAKNDGVGDFPGLLQKLDYIASLGVNAIWLLPFY